MKWPKIYSCQWKDFNFFRLLPRKMVSKEGIELLDSMHWRAKMWHRDTFKYLFLPFQWWCLWNAAGRTLKVLISEMCCKTPTWVQAGFIWWKLWAHVPAIQHCILQTCTSTTQPLSLKSLLIQIHYNEKTA